MLQRTDTLVAIALELARTGEAESSRLQALAWLRDSGYTRPAERHEIAVDASSASEDEDLSGLTIDQLRELDRLEEQRERIMALRDSNPLVLDGDRILLPAAVAQCTTLTEDES